jgi:hypothetical protein
LRYRSRRDSLISENTWTDVSENCRQPSNPHDRLPILGYFRGVFAEFLASRDALGSGQEIVEAFNGGGEEHGRSGGGEFWILNGERGGSVR